MTEEKRICPFMPVFTVRDYRGMLPAQLGRDYSECLEEKCMAWEPDSTIEVRATGDYGLPLEEYIVGGGLFKAKTVPAHCRLIK